MRFGFRDYDPYFGRFTAKDPIGDTGGDHDLWDYCVDDPVSMNDPSGLIPPLILAGLGAAGSWLLGYGGSRLAAWAADKADSFRTGKESTKATDGVKEVEPYAKSVHDIATVPLTIGAGAATRRMGEAFASHMTEHVVRKATEKPRKKIE